MRKLGILGRIAAIAAIIAAATGAPAVAQGEKPKIALYIANDKLKPEEKNVLTRKFLSPFTASGLYSVIDRSDIFTQKANQERIKQRDGSVNEKEIYKIGYEAGAKYVCIVELDNAFGRWNIAARMVDVVTAEVYLAQGETDIAGELNKADISGAAQTVFNQIHRKSGGSVVSAARTKEQEDSAEIAKARELLLIGRREEALAQQQSISYGGKTYKTVVIGGKRWMAENLNYQTASGSWCYEDNSSNCYKYGRLYDWKTARTVCPAGWHLPSAAEWDKLTSAVGGTRTKYKNNNTGKEFFGWAGAGTKLKAKSGWNDNGNGTDDYGFSALPGGTRITDGSFYNAVGFGYWWAATEYDGDYAYFRSMDYYYDYVKEGYIVKDAGYSVRCMQD